MVDGFDGLAHHPVIRRHDQDDHVRHLSTPGPHGREGLMAGRVEEDDVPVLELDMIGADGLGYPPRLPGDDIRFPDGVEE